MAQPKLEKGQLPQRMLYTMTYTIRCKTPVLIGDSCIPKIAVNIVITPGGANRNRLTRIEKTEIAPTAEKAIRRLSKGLVSCMIATGKTARAPIERNRTQSESVFFDGRAAKA